MNGTGSNNITFGANLMVIALGTAALLPVLFESYSDILPSEVVKYNHIPINSWELDLLKVDNQDVINFGSLKIFTESLISNTQNIDPEILNVVNKNFWDLL